MTIPYNEITAKHHMICGAFLFYRLDNELYKRYLITSYNEDETLSLEEIE